MNKHLLLKDTYIRTYIAMHTSFIFQFSAVVANLNNSCFKLKILTVKF